MLRFGMALFAVSTKQSADSCQRCFVDTTNRAMPNLCMQLVERRFYNNGSNKEVQGCYAKLTTNAAATADFLAAYDAKGSPLAELSSMGQAESASCSYFTLRALALS